MMHVLCADSFVVGRNAFWIHQGPLLNSTRWLALHERFPLAPVQQSVEGGAEAAQKRGGICNL